MRKKNGFTSIELLVSFIIVSAIVIGLFDVVLNYRNKQQISAYETSIQSYINEMTKLMEDDLIKRKLTAVTVSGRQAVLTFQTPKDGSTVSNLIINQTDRYIQYGEAGKEMKYPIPNIMDLEITNYKLEKSNNFFVIEVVFLHPNFSKQKRIRIATPINYTK